MDAWDEEHDLIVFGSGAGGMAASLVGALRGLDVALFEKDAQVGGTTATSGGAIWIVASTQACDAGIEDSLDRGRDYLRHETGNHYREDLAEAFLTRGAEAIDYLADNSDVTFIPVPIPDYHADAPGGAKTGRTMMPPPFDGRRLGKAFELLRPPTRQYLVLGGMMIGRDEAATLTSGSFAPRVLALGARLVLRHAADRLRFSRGTRLIGGNALIARFLYSLRRRRVAIRAGTALVGLLKEEGRVVGATVRDARGERRVRARRGVVLATGGPAHDPDARAEFMSAFPHEHSLAFEGDTGDGFRSARAVGGSVDADVATPAVWTPASLLREKDGQVLLNPYGFLDRGKPGAIAVDGKGRRFVNESNSYQDVVAAMYANAAPGRPVAGHLVFDATFLWKYGAGLVPPRTRRLRRWVDAAYLVRADTVRNLAAVIGVPADALEESVRRHNGFAETGVDADFHKGESIFNRYNGDAAVAPNPCLAPIVKPPFYALAMHPTTLGMSLGLRTDADAQVLDAAGAPIPGLYACGNEMGSVMRGYCPAGGVTLGPAIVFGYIAATHAAAHG